MRSRFPLFILLWIVAAAPCRGDEAWGYLWEFGQERLHTLVGDRVELGRLPGSDVVLADPRVSRRHAEIRREKGGVVLMDLGSTNGTRLNGQAVIPGEPVPLAPGDLLVVGYEKLLYHDDRSKLWSEVLDHSLLAAFVRVKVPVLCDRSVRVLGTERLVQPVSHAGVDPETGKVQVDYSEATPSDPGFRPEEVAFVADVGIVEGEIRLSLWGLARGGTLVSRRASLSHLKHGELRIGLSAPSAREARARLETGWSEQGVPFLRPLLRPVLERLPEGEGSRLTVNLATSLLEQEGTAGPRDAARALTLLHRFDRADPELPVLAARAHARWVKRRVQERRGALSPEERSELDTLLGLAKSWLKSASELGADDERIKVAEAEIAEAEKLLPKVP